MLRISEYLQNKSMEVIEQMKKEKSDYFKFSEANLFITTKKENNGDTLLLSKFQSFESNDVDNVYYLYQKIL